MPVSKGRARVRTITSETRAALINTLLGIISLSTVLVNNQFHYVLLGMFQSDDLESEFGKYRQMSGGCFFISVEQVLMSARLRKLALFNQLQIDGNRDHDRLPCCVLEFTETELEALDSCIVDEPNISDDENSVLYFICGYVARKENFPQKTIDVQLPESEFTTMVSRGGLQHPPHWLFKFSR